MTYPGVLVYCATCHHMEQVHAYGKRGGMTVRTACTHMDPAGSCGCLLFAYPVLAPAGGRPVSAGWVAVKARDGRTYHPDDVEFVYHQEGP